MGRSKGSEEVVPPLLNQTCSWLTLAISMETVENQLSCDQKSHSPNYKSWKRHVKDCEWVLKAVSLFRHQMMTVYKVFSCCYISIKYCIYYYVCVKKFSMLFCVNEVRLVYLQKFFLLAFFFTSIQTSCSSECSSCWWTVNKSLANLTYCVWQYCGGNVILCECVN